MTLVLVQTTLLQANQQEKLMVHLDWYVHLRCESHGQQCSFWLYHEWMRKCKGEKDVQDNKSITYRKEGDTKDHMTSVNQQQKKKKKCQKENRRKSRNNCTETQQQHDGTRTRGRRLTHPRGQWTAGA